MRGSVCLARPLFGSSSLATATMTKPSACTPQPQPAVPESCPGEPLETELKQNVKNGKGEEGDYFQFENEYWNVTY